MAMANKIYGGVGDQITAIAHELSRLTIACRIDISQGGIAERILNGDQSVCGQKNEKAFTELQHHLMALFSLEGRAIDDLGVDETKIVIDQVRHAIMRLREIGGSA